MNDDLKITQASTELSSRSAKRVDEVDYRVNGTLDH